MTERNRKCLKCQTDFVLKAKDKSSNICNKCKAAYQREYARKKVAESPDGYKEKYPYDETKKFKRFTEIRQTLDKMKQREEWQIFFKERLDYLEQNEQNILVWIYDRRDQDSRNEERGHRTEKKEYEDTRTTHQNKSWFD